MTGSAALLKKLQVKSGARLWLVNVPQEIAETLTAGAEVEPVHMGDACDGVIAFCENPVEVASFARQAVAQLPEDGLLWFGYRKGRAVSESGLGRDRGWEALAELGYRPVRSIAFDDTWSGIRFRPVDKVRAKPGSVFSRPG